MVRKKVQQGCWRGAGGVEKLGGCYEGLSEDSHLSDLESATRLSRETAIKQRNRAQRLRHKEGRDWSGSPTDSHEADREGGR